jgi:hypothetical protein
MPIDVIPVLLNPDGLLPEAERHDTLIIATFTGTRLLVHFKQRQVRRITAGIALDETVETWHWDKISPIRLGHTLAFECDHEPYFYRTSWILAISRLNSNIPKDFGH